jgi:NADH-quinone oxidoreductase subunit F
MSDYDLGALQPLFDKYAPQGRSALLRVLLSAQKQYRGLPEAVTAEISRGLNVPLADIYGVIEFYAMLSTEPVGETVVRVCTDPACAMRGGKAILDGACEHLGLQPDEVSQDGRYQVVSSPCLGLCEHAPAALVGEQPAGLLNPSQPEAIFNANPELPATLVGGTIRILTKNCDGSHTTSLEQYLASGGYQAVRRAFQMPAAEVIAEVKASGLAGRGGAAFPTGVKWEGAANAEGFVKYFVCNADESEPGAFKDRVLLEGDPHKIIEGMLIGAYAIGARIGYIYLRGEYGRAFEVMRQALADAGEAGYLGENIFGSGFGFQIELRQGAGAYICGEETALFESLEGKRGFPRMKPPFPTTHGLFGKPTAINNVETLCNVPYILENGAQAFRQIGTQKSPGPKLFCISGDVARPGLYEVPMGFNLRDLLFDLAGGMRSEQPLQAVLIGGAAGNFGTEADLDVRLSFEDLQAASLPLGAGVIMVFDQSRSMAAVLQQLAHFFADESCGKCYPCQIGTQRQLEILQRVSSGNPFPGDDLRLQDVGWTMTDSSLCGLGQTAALAVLSAMKLWPDLFTAQAEQLATKP